MESNVTMGRKAKGYLLAALVVLMALGMATMPVAAQGMTQNRIPASAFFGQLENPCSGEALQPHGWVLMSQQVTRNGFVLHISGLTGVYAVGEDSGDVYRINGAFQWVWQGEGDETYLHNYRWIGSEPGQRFHLHELYRATYTPDGDLAVEVEVLDIECR
jgi:hypothetical protein